VEPGTRYKYVKFSVSIREDVNEKLNQLIHATGLDRSGVVALLIQRTDMRTLSSETKTSQSKD
jgi:hypothetical protein